LNPRGGFIPLPLSRRVPWTGLGDASQINGSSTQISKHYLYAENTFNARAEGVGFEPTRSANPFRFSRPVPSATRRALHPSFLHLRFLLFIQDMQQDLNFDLIPITNSVHFIFVSWLEIDLAFLKRKSVRRITLKIIISQALVNRR
jgi:hypothetical protein